MHMEDSGAYTSPALLLEIDSLLRELGRDLAVLADRPDDLGVRARLAVTPERLSRRALRLPSATMVALARRVEDTCLGMRAITSPLPPPVLAALWEGHAALVDQLEAVRAGTDVAHPWRALRALDRCIEDILRNG